MPRYLFSAVVSPGFMERIREHGLSVAEKNAEALAAHFGGTAIANYLAFESDGPRVYVIGDLPDEAVPVLLLSASQGPTWQPGTLRAVRLMNGAEVDEIVTEHKKLPTPTGEPLKQ